MADSSVPEPQWFVSHHAASKAGGRQEFLKSFMAKNEDGTMVRIGQVGYEDWRRTLEEKALAMGVYLCALMPSSVAQEGIDGPMFCVWETKAGTTVSQMNEFLGSDCFPINGLMTSACHPIAPTPGFTPYPHSKWKGDTFPAMPKPSEISSKFWVLHHVSKSGMQQELARRMEAMSPNDLQELFAKAAAAGYAGQSSMPCATPGIEETYCVWETKMEITKHEMEALFDGPLLPVMNGLAVNTAYEIDLSVAGVPYPPKLLPEPQWFLSHHTKLKDGGRTEFIEKLKKTAQTPDMATLIEDVALRIGFHRCAIMPVAADQEGPDGPIFCVWEAKAGTTALEMKSFLGDDSCFPISGLMASSCHLLQYNPMAPPYPVSKLKGQKKPFIPAAQDMESKFWMLHHVYKQIDSHEVFLKAFADMAPEDAKAMMDRALEAGFAGHCSMHSLNEGIETFCVWETRMDIKKSEMEAFFDGPLFTPTNGLSVNTAYPIDISLLGVPYPPKITNVSPRSPKRGGS